MSTRLIAALVGFVASAISIFTFISGHGTLAQALDRLTGATPPAVARPAVLQLKAVIVDPDGYTNVRSAPRVDSSIVARVTDGEVFFTNRQDGRWWAVRTLQGVEGFMHVSRIRVLE